ncbi:alanyl-tRNA editing protein [Thermotoga sp. KOL6]|uniref:alanyl-tRNA editing protein n=1 Tax=Thermotoga sp. KOL6 TaxID=126741 RepID=UPI000C786401|nr:alanyl-tRNA editing protein [Thermotoga sp. KOL6]PLV60110.1 alanyl-tRNA editing protein [Thermotoga sp. KOL6]
MNVRTIKIERVVMEKEKTIAIAKESPFYPDGKGGQLGDRGRIGPANVIKVKEQGKYILHYLDAPIEPGEYEYEIDLSRRKDIACQHTAQHILSAAFLKVADLETVSFHMGEEISTIVLNAPFVLEEVLEEVEDLANDVVRDCERVEISELTYEEVSELNLRKLPMVKGKIRVVKIGDFDITACGGFHVENTGEIGLIKIIDSEKVKRTFTRVYFVAGKRALKDYKEKDRILKLLSKILTTSSQELVKRVENLLKSVKEKSTKLDKLSEKYAQLLSKTIKPEKIGRFDFYFLNKVEEGKFLPKFLADQENAVIVLEYPDHIEIVSNWVDCREIFKKVKEKMNVKGGSGQKRAAMFVDSPEKAVEEIKEILRWF